MLAHGQAEMSPASPKAFSGAPKPPKPKAVARKVAAKVKAASISMRRALEDPQLLGGVLAGDSWKAWRVILIAAWGEALTDGERIIFTRLTGRAREPMERCEELWAIIGRRGGKSRAISTLIAFIACLVDHSSKIVPGERPIVLCLAPTAKQSGVVLDYVNGIIESSPMLARLIVSKTADSITLSNGIDVEIRPASFRGVRGVTTVAVVGDEAAFWYSEDTASTNPDSAILDAVRPSLATTGGMLAIISSPYARKGAVYEAYTRHYGENGDKLVLVAKGASRDFNPSLPQKVVDRAYEKDALAASAEYGGEFRSDLERFITLEAVTACLMPGTHELPPQRGRTYVGFVDAAGGSGADAMTMAISYKDDFESVAVLACLREVKPPFSPEQTVFEFVRVLRSYGISEIRADRFGADWVSEAFARHNIRLVPSDKTRSEIYGEILPALNSREVRILDSKKLVAQFVGLERRTGRSGKDSINHGPGAHDDLCNSAAGALVYAVARRGRTLHWG
jgi:hypothetical protein